MQALNLQCLHFQKKLKFARYLLEALTRTTKSCHEYRATPDSSAAAFCSLVKVPKLTNAAPTQILVSGYLEASWKHHSKTGDRNLNWVLYLVQNLQ
jgi:hypothetical protein